MNGYELVRLQPNQLKKTGDTMTGDLKISANIVPTTNNARDLGSPSLAFRKVYGSATSADKLTTARGFSINGIRRTFNGEGDISWTLAEIGAASTNHNQASNTITAMTGYTKGNTSSAITTSDTLNSAIGKLENKVDSKANSTHTHNYAGSNTAGGAANSALTCTGNSATATKLQTPRNINGVAFDGTKNITVADNTKLPLTGGTLTGDLKIAKSNAQLTLNGKDTNYYQIAHSSANGTLVFNYNTKGLFTVQNNGSIIPITNKSMSIGDYNYRISDLYVGNNTGDKENGYTTLSNGYTLMWGSNVIPAYPVSTTVAETQITFPLVTKDQCYPMVSSYDIDGKLLTVRSLDANGFKVVVRNLYHDTPTWNHRINWCCLVKL